MIIISEKIKTVREEYSLINSKVDLRSLEKSRFKRRRSVVRYKNNKYVMKENLNSEKIQR